MRPIPFLIVFTAMLSYAPQLGVILALLVTWATCCTVALLWQLCTGKEPNDEQSRPDID